MKESRYNFTAIIVIGAMLTLPLFAQDNYEVNDIEFLGNKVFSGGTLLDQISMYTLNRFEKLILGKEPYYFTQEMFESDLDRLKWFYQQEGFLHVLVDKLNFEVNHKERTVAVSLKITEGDPITVTNVNAHFSDDSNEDNDIIESVINKSTNQAEGLVAMGLVSSMVSQQLAKSVGSELNLDFVELNAKDNWQRATLGVGKYLTNDLYVSYQREFGEKLDADTPEEIIILEYELIKHFYLHLIQAGAKHSGADLILKLEW
jgi:hypothetical protein